VTVITKLLNGLFDLLVAPFGASAAWAVLVLSLLTGLVMLLLFKAATKQDKLVAARRVLTGHLYEMGLYQDHFSVLLKIQRDVALANLRYLGRTLPALLVILVPMVLILAQMDSRFTSRPFQAGETTLVTARLADEHAELLDRLSLQGGEGLVVETPAVRDRQALTATWRVRITAPGSHEATVAAAGGGAWSKRLTAEGSLPQLARTREQAGWHFLLLNPGESPLPADSPLLSISTQLPPRHTAYLGIEMHWLLALCLFSLAFGFAVKDIFRVKF